MRMCIYIFNEITDKFSKDNSQHNREKQTSDVRCISSWWNWDNHWTRHIYSFSLFSFSPSLALFFFFFFFALTHSQRLSGLTNFLNERSINIENQRTGHIAREKEGKKRNGWETRSMQW